MTRQDANRLAEVVRQAFLAAEGNAKVTKGVHLTAMMIAQHVENEGKMGGRIFLQEVGILPAPESP